MVPWLFAASVLFAIPVLAAPRSCVPLTASGSASAPLLVRIVQPIVLGLMFYAIFKSFALIFVGLHGSR